MERTDGHDELQLTGGEGRDHTERRGGLSSCETREREREKDAASSSVKKEKKTF